MSRSSHKFSEHMCGKLQHPYYCATEQVEIPQHEIGITSDLHAQSDDFLNMIKL